MSAARPADAAMPFDRPGVDDEELEARQKRAEFAEEMGVKLDDDGFLPLSIPLPEKLLEECERIVGLDSPNAEFRRLIKLSIVSAIYLHKDVGVIGPQRRGRPSRAGFERLVFALAITFEHLKGKRATITWNPHRERYTGPFWELVERLAPEAGVRAGSGLWARSGFAPATEAARGRKISRSLVPLARIDDARRQDVVRDLAWRLTLDGDNAAWWLIYMDKNSR